MARDSPRYTKIYYEDGQPPYFPSVFADPALIYTVSEWSAISITHISCYKPIPVEVAHHSPSQNYCITAETSGTATLQPERPSKVESYIRINLFSQQNALKTARLAKTASAKNANLGFSASKLVSFKGQFVYPVV